MPYNAALGQTIPAAGRVGKSQREQNVSPRMKGEVSEVSTQQQDRWKIHEPFAVVDERIARLEHRLRKPSKMHACTLRASMLTPKHARALFCVLYACLLQRRKPPTLIKRR